jgi:hypothetical protein
MVIHSTDEKIIREFAMKKTVSRLLVNTPAALGGVGATTNLAPALTLGCGTVGKGATSDNITPLNLINIRRVAAGCRSLEELRAAAAAVLPGPAGPGPVPPGAGGRAAPPRMPGGYKLDAGDLEAITELVAEKLARLSGRQDGNPGPGH